MKNLILAVVIIVCGIFYSCEKQKPKLADNVTPLTPVIPKMQKPTTLEQLIETII